MIQTENKANDNITKNYIKEANYENGKKESDGQIKYENGNYYKGEEKNLKRHGKGIEYYKNGGVKLMEIG
jgi:antitoxin component YwqK of YwqJK toxin-antitoxin module